MNHGEPHLFCKSYTLEEKLILTSQLFSEKESFMVCLDWGFRRGRDGWFTFLF